MTRLILASGSPRRRQLLALTGLDFDIITADVDEESVAGTSPADDALVTAELKAVAVAHSLSEPAIVIGSDTNVALGERILQKPRDSAEARQMLTALRNRAHQVHTGIVVIRTADLHTVKTVTSSDVFMRDYTDTEIADYIATGDPLDKAGAYAIQHPVFKPVAHWHDCFAAIMGLSICETLRLLTEVGVQVPAHLDLLTRQTFPCAGTHCYQQSTYDPHQ